MLTQRLGYIKAFAQGWQKCREGPGPRRQLGTSPAASAWLLRAAEHIMTVVQELERDNGNRF